MVKIRGENVLRHSCHRYRDVEKVQCRDSHESRLHGLTEHLSGEQRLRGMERVCGWEGFKKRIDRVQGGVALICFIIITSVTVIQRVFVDERMDGILPVHLRIPTRSFRRH